VIIYFVLLFLWLFFYLIISSLSNHKENSKLRKWYTVISGGLLFLIMGLRHFTVGGDLKQYLAIYNSIPTVLSDNLFSNSEWGYYVFIKILKMLSVNDQGYIIIISLVISFSFSVFFYKYSRNLFLSFFLHLTIGLFSMSMSGIRQTIAICLILLAFKYLLNNRLFGFIFAVLLASTFHNTALVFLPVYFLKKINITKRNGLMLLAGVAITIFLREQVTPLIEFFMPERYALRYDLISQDYPVNPLLIVIALAIPMACLIFWNEVEKLGEREKMLFSILFVLSCINAFANILSLNSNILGRLSFYFITFNVVLIPNIISIIKDKNIKIIGILLCISLPLIQFILSTPGGTYLIDNYKFFWE
jgi:hypothetical protein